MVSSILLCRLYETILRSAAFRQGAFLVWRINRQTVFGGERLSAASGVRARLEEPMAAWARQIDTKV